MHIWYALLWLCVFVLGYCGTFPQASIAATFYVATTGNDSHPGTAAQPWATLQRAANVVNPGDRVVVRAGNYRGRSLVVLGQQLHLSPSPARLAQ
jgi:hypothetical protein